MAALGVRPTNSYGGLTSQELAREIAADYTPTKYIESEADLLKAVTKYSSVGVNGFFDYFSAAAIPNTNGLIMLPVVSDTWWCSPQNAMVTKDLNNIVPANNAVDVHRGAFIPGKVVRAIYDNGFWRAGIGYIDDMETNMYEPAAQVKGDIARIYMYMAIVYPQSLWLDAGVMIYTDGGYPYICRYGRELLLKWHRDDPVDEFERCRNTAIREVQGSGNPFVEIEDLAEYLWGNKAGEVYPQPPVIGPDPAVPTPDPTPQPEPEPNPDPEPEPTPTPEQRQTILLKGVYSIATDVWLDFKSPYIDAGSQWAVDGRPVSSSLMLSELGEGRHEVSFKNEKSHGKLSIRIEK